MNTPHCCQTQPHTGDRARRSGSWLRRARETAGWLLPGTVLALLPKCPMCVAAYVALGTGVTLSYASAHILLRALTAVCIGALALCQAQRMMKYYRQSRTSSTHLTNTLQ